jgi:hypothetical protein
MQITTKHTENTAKQEEEKLETLLLEGLRSEPGMEIGSEEWKKFRNGLALARKKPQHKEA